MIGQDRRETPPHIANIIGHLAVPAKFADGFVRYFFGPSLGADRAAALRPAVQAALEPYYDDLCAVCSGVGLEFFFAACTIVQKAVLRTVLPLMVGFSTSRKLHLAHDVTDVLAGRAAPPRRGNPVAWATMRNPPPWEQAFKQRDWDAVADALRLGADFDTLMVCRPYLRAEEWVGCAVGFLTGVHRPPRAARPLSEILNDPALHAALDRVRGMLGRFNPLARGIPEVKSFLESLDLDEPAGVGECREFEGMMEMLNQRELSLASTTHDSRCRVTKRWCEEFPYPARSDGF